MSAPASRRARSGTTLVELLVVVAVLGFVGAVATLALRTSAAPPPDSALARVVAARRRAVASGRAIELRFTDDSAVHPVRALPDGRVLGAASLHVDPLSGRAGDAER